jgi:long-chain acyl-CoA synthetase
MRNLGRMIEERCRTYAGNAFLCYPADDSLVRISYREFLGDVVRWAAALKSRGIEPGDRVGIITPKSPHQVRAFYACWWLGAIAVPICEGLGDLEMGFIIRDSEPAVILIDESMADKVAANCGDIPLATFGALTEDSAGLPPDAVACRETDEDAIAALIYTSGSTGMPKGVMLTHRNFYVNASSTLDVLRFDPCDRIISLLPYWHSYALVCEVICAAMAGAQTIVPRDKRDFRRNITAYQPTIVLVVPRIADAIKTGIEKRIAEATPRVRSLFEKAVHNASRIFTAGPRLDGGLLRLVAHHSFYDPVVFRKIRKSFGGKVRFFVSGGAPLDLEHQIFFKYIGMPMYQGYGLTESAPIVSSNLPERHKLGSAGMLFPWLKAENGGDFTFRDDKGQVGRDVKGELLVKGDCVMKGYWRHTDVSAKTLADGWLHTGDMGYVDEDGYLFLEGRQGNMIVLFGGEKLHPEHVEDAIKSCKRVVEAMVIGEKCKNVYVLVNVDPERTAGLSAAELNTEVRAEVMAATEHLAAYQRPKDVLVLPEFSPDDGTLTVTLKVRRHRIWELYGREIREFLKQNGEDVATKEDVRIASSRVMETLGRN